MSPPARDVSLGRGPDGKVRAGVPLPFRNIEVLSAIATESASTLVVSIPQPLAGNIQFASASTTVFENAGTIQVTLTRTNGSSGAISATVTDTGGTAVVGTDFVDVNQTVSWADGDTTVKTIPVSIVDRTGTVQGHQTLELTVGSPTNGATIGAQSTTTINITDIDSSQTATGTTITTVDVTDSSPGTTRPVSVGMPFGEGALANGQALVVTDSLGNVQPSQWNQLTTWRTDGSQLHGVITFECDGSDTYEIKEGTAATGTDITKADLVTAGFDAVVSVDILGTVYSLSASDLLSGIITPRTDYTHFTGPKAAEFWVGGPLKVNGNGSEHGHLGAMFYCRAYEGGNRVHCTAVLENIGTFNTLANLIGDVIVTIGGIIVKNRVAQDIHTDERLPARGWFNGDPNIETNHDVEYIKNTFLTPPYRSDLIVNEVLLSNLGQSFEWRDPGPYPANMTGGGAGSWIAPLPRWEAAYLISGDVRAKRAVIAHSDILGWIKSRNPDVKNVRDETTGFPLNMETPENSSWIGHDWGGARALPAGNSSGSPVKDDLAHSPSSSMLAYLLTGDGHFLEQVQLWGVSAWIMEAPGGSQNGWPRTYFSGQTRSVAWGGRNIMNAGVITPDNHPLQSYLRNNVGHFINSIQNDLRPFDTNDNLGVALANLRDTGFGASTGIAPWQSNFLVTTMGAVYQRGWKPDMDASGVMAWISQGIIKQLGDGTGDTSCWTRAAADTKSVKAISGGTLFADWNTIWNQNYPQDGGVCPVPGGAMFGGDTDATNKGAQAGGAIAVVAEAGAAGASDSWNRYAARDITDYALNNSEYSDAPEWAQAPRAGLAPNWVSDLTLNQWTALSTTNVFQDVWATDQGQYGNLTPRAVFVAWNGAALVKHFGEFGTLVHWGGGHKDYYGNEVYAFDLASLTWSRLNEPSPIDGFAKHPDGILPDGTPRVAHTYYLIGSDGTRLIPAKRETSNDGGFAVNALSVFDLDTKVWTDVYTDTSGLPMKNYDGYVYDSTRGLFWMVTQQPVGIASVDPDVGTWTSYTAPSGNFNNRAGAVYVPTKDCIISFPDGPAFGLDPGNPTNDRVDIVTSGVGPGVFSRGDMPHWSNNLNAIVYYENRSDVLHFLTPPAGDWRAETWVWSTPALLGNTGVHDSTTPTLGKFQVVEWGPITVATIIADVNGPYIALRLA